MRFIAKVMKKDESYIAATPKMTVVDEKKLAEVTKEENIQISKRVLKFIKNTLYSRVCMG